MFAVTANGFERLTWIWNICLRVQSPFSARDVFIVLWLKLFQLNYIKYYFRALNVKMVSVPNVIIDISSANHKQIWDHSSNRQRPVAQKKSNSNVEVFVKMSKLNNGLSFHIYSIQKFHTKGIWGNLHSKPFSLPLNASIGANVTVWWH